MTTISASLSSPVCPEQDHVITTHESPASRGGPEAGQDIMAIASHELLSPLNLIRGYAVTLSELGDTLTPEQRRSYLKGIELNVTRASLLVRNYLELPAIESGRLSLGVQPTSLPELVRRVVGEMQTQGAGHVIKLRSPGSAPLLNIDRGRIEQVMINLLTNALKYSLRGGSDIQVSIKRSRARNGIPGAPTEKMQPVDHPALTVSVRDSGMGIPESEFDLVFEKYHRVDNPLSRATPGVGLGLYVSKVIVEAHGGCIWASNNIGGGSTFSFSLPVAPPAPCWPR